MCALCSENAELYLMLVQSGRTITHWAAAGGHADILKLVINNYLVDPDVRDEVNYFIVRKFILNY